MTNDQHIRTQLIREAREWIGTRFHHQGRLKATSSDKGGCDCIGLVIGTADNIGLKYNGESFSNFDVTDYARIPDGEKLQQVFDKYLKKIEIDDAIGENAKGGDILMFRFNKHPQHVGITSKMIGKLSIIHCYMQAKCVVEHRLDEHWKKRIVGAYSFL